MTSICSFSICAAHQESRIHDSTFGRRAYFRRAAARMVELIRKRWKKAPDIQCFYVIGGGAAALKPYILEAAGSMRLRFTAESEFLNMYGYLKVAKNRMNQAALV